MVPTQNGLKLQGASGTAAGGKDIRVNGTTPSSFQTSGVVAFYLKLKTHSGSEKIIRIKF